MSCAIRHRGAGCGVQHVQKIRRTHPGGHCGIQNLPHLPEASLRHQRALQTQQCRPLDIRRRTWRTERCCESGPGASQLPTSVKRFGCKNYFGGMLARHLGPGYRLWSLTQAIQHQPELDRQSGVGV